MFCRPNVLICRTIMNSTCSAVFCMDIKTIIISLKNSSYGYDELSASIAKQCIYNYVVPLTYIISMTSELKLANVVPIFKSGESDS